MKTPYAILSLFQLEQRLVCSMLNYIGAELATALLNPDGTTSNWVPPDFHMDVLDPQAGVSLAHLGMDLDSIQAATSEMGNPSGDTSPFLSCEATFEDDLDNYVSGVLAAMDMTATRYTSPVTTTTAYDVESAKVRVVQLIDDANADGKRLGVIQKDIQNAGTLMGMAKSLGYLTEVRMLSHHIADYSAELKVIKDQFGVSTYITGNPLTGMPPRP